MLDMNVIEKSTSPYTSPIVIVRKKDGSNRFCIDFRKLNKITLFDCEPMPRADDIFVKLKDDQFFSSLDLSKGYWQVAMRDEDKEKTAFVAPDRGVYQFTRMPFGLVNSAATFNRLMRRVLGDMKCVSCYVDDVLIHTRSWEEHVRVLHEVFTRIQKAGLTLKAAKCHIGYKHIEYVGHHVGQGVIRPLAHNLEKILKAPRPMTKRDVRSFVGLASYYRKHINHFANLMSSLTDLTLKDKPNKVEWTEVHEKAFQEIKDLLCSAPILQMPDCSKPFILQVDACDEGIGAALFQEVDGEMLPIGYASRKLLDREKKYAIMEKECLAVVYAVKHFHQYLYGSQFILQTDHMPLVCLNQNRSSNDRIMRWSLQLQPYSMCVEYIKGSDNVTADYLSRNPIS